MGGWEVTHVRGNLLCLSRWRLWSTLLRANTLHPVSLLVMYFVSTGAILNIMNVLIEHSSLHLACCTNRLPSLNNEQPIKPQHGSSPFQVFTSCGKICFARGWVVSSASVICKPDICSMLWILLVAGLILSMLWLEVGGLLWVVG